MAHIQVVKVEKHLKVVYMTNDNNLCGPVLHAPCEEVSRKQILDTSLQMVFRVSTLTTCASVVMYIA